MKDVAAPPGTGNPRPGDRGAATDSLLSILDQGLCSLSSFLTVVIVARGVSSEAFGVYTLLFAAILILGGVQNSLITGPLRVLGVRGNEDETPGYLRAQMRLQFLLSGSLSLAAIVFLALLTSFRGGLVIAFACCLFVGQLQELTRIISLTQLKLRWLLFLDGITHTLRLALLLLLWKQNLLTPTTALWALAAASAAGAGAFFLGATPVRRDGGTPLIAVLTENWDYGRWLLLETVAFTVSTRAYFFFTASLVGMQSVGALNAVQSLLGVINVLVLGMTGVAIPIARSSLMREGYSAWCRWLWQVAGFLTAVTTVLVVATSVFARPLLTTLFSPVFGEYAYLVAILGIGQCLVALNSVLSMAFRTARLPQIGVVAKVVSAVITLSLALPLLREWGVAGAAWGLVATQVIWTAVYFVYLARGTLRSARVLPPPVGAPG